MVLHPIGFNTSCLSGRVWVSAEAEGELPQICQIQIRITLINTSYWPWNHYKWQWWIATKKQYHTTTKYFVLIKGKSTQVAVLQHPVFPQALILPTKLVKQVRFLQDLLSYNDMLSWQTSSLTWYIVYPLQKTHWLLLKIIWNDRIGCKTAHDWFQIVFKDTLSCTTLKIFIW